MSEDEVKQKIEEIKKLIKRNHLESIAYIAWGWMT
jgi:hypothetical protein